MINVTGAYALVRSLSRHQVQCVFAYTGGAIIPVVDELFKQKMPYYMPTNEQSLGYAATGRSIYMIVLSNRFVLKLFRRAYMRYEAGPLQIITEVK